MLGRWMAPLRAGVRWFASPQKPKKYKLKTHSGACKRFKVMGDGRVKRWQAGAHHKMRYLTPDQRRRKKETRFVHSTLAKKIRIMMQE